MKYFGLVCALTVFASHLAAIELIDCPKIVPDRHDALVLKSNEDKCVQLKTAVAKQSETIKQLLGKNQAILPLTNLNNLQLKDIATIMDQGYGRTNDFFKRTFEAVMKTNQNYLIQMIDAANYLHIERVLNAALDVFAQKILQDDLPALGKFNEEGYANYKSQVLERLPDELGAMLVHRQSKLFRPSTLTIFKLSESVDKAVFSRDGSRVLTASEYVTVKVWDAKMRGYNGKPLAILKHAGSVTDLSFSPDGKRILTASLDNTAKLWDASVRGDNVQALATLRSPGATLGAEFSSSGKRILTRSYPNTAWVWDANVTTDFPKPTSTLNNVASVQLSPDETRILTKSLDNKTVALWDANAKGDDLQPIAKLNFESTVNQAGFSPDGKYIVVATSKHGALVWDEKVKGDDSKPLASLKHDDSDGVWGFKFSPDASRLLTLATSIKLWDTNIVSLEPKPLATFKKPEGFAEIEFSPNGRRFLVTPLKGVPTLWDANAKGSNTQPLAILKKSNLVGKRVKAEFSPDGKYILTVAEGNFLKYWNASVRGEDAEPIGDYANSIFSSGMFSPDGKSYLATGNGNATLFAFLDTSRLDLAQAQVILYARKNKLKAEQLPKHLLLELSDEARIYLSGE